MKHIRVDKADVPALGLGTYRLQGSECERIVKTALELGYRHIDTAEYYTNQAAIGSAIEAASVDRGELFITTKIWKSNLEATAARQSTLSSLRKLGVDSVDLLLIHWPNERVPIEETIGAMNELQKEERVGHIGVSNFSATQLKGAMKASETPIVTNQVEYNPYTPRSELRAVCAKNDIILTAYSPLAKGKVVNDQTLRSIGNRYDKSAAQVTLRWLLQQEMVAAIPKAASTEHLKSNRAIFDFELTEAEMKKIAEIGRH